MTATIRSHPRALSVLGWASVIVSTGAWIVHLVFSVAYTTGALGDCATFPEWPIHAMSAITGVTCLVTLAVSAWITRVANATVEGTESAQLHFLGMLGVGTSIFNFVLIVAEGSFVLFLWTC